MMCKKHNVEKKDFCINIYTKEIKKLCPVCVQNKNAKAERRTHIEDIKFKIRFNKIELNDLKREIKYYRNLIKTTK